MTIKKPIMRVLIVMFFACFSISSFAAIYHVGPTRDYKSPNELYLASVLQDGDEIEIDAATYIGNEVLAVWQPDNLIIRGVGGMPALDADGEYINGKGIWVLAGDNITIENIEFFGASVPDQNGAGIRLDGSGLTVRHCYFHDNENGILTNNTFDGDITIEYTEFDNNGFGDGQSHNLYIGHCNKLTFRFNYSHNASIGHLLKSRAAENYILYNRIMDEEDGNSSRIIDIPNGGICVLMGNLFMQGENASNKNLIGYGLEGYENIVPNDFYTVSNTMVNKKSTGCFFFHLADGVDNVTIENNILAGTGDIFVGSGFDLGTNLIESDIESIGFNDEPSFNYEIGMDSPAVDFGAELEPVNGVFLMPEFEYVHPTGSKPRNANNTIDAGAYEYESMVSNEDLEIMDLSVFPNPVSDILYLSSNYAQIGEVTLYDLLGRIVQRQYNPEKLDMSALKSGLYILNVTKDHQRKLSRIISKQ